MTDTNVTVMVVRHKSISQPDWLLIKVGRDGRSYLRTRMISQGSSMPNAKVDQMLRLSSNTLRSTTLYGFHDAERGWLALVEATLDMV